MKWRKWIASTALAGVLAFSGTAHAAASASDDNTHDGRTEGYSQSVQYDGSNGLLWVIFILVSVISLSAMFKDSRRARTE